MGDDADQAASDVLGTILPKAKTLPVLAPGRVALWGGVFLVSSCAVLVGASYYAGGANFDQITRSLEVWFLAVGAVSVGLLFWQLRMQHNQAVIQYHWSRIESYYQYFQGAPGFEVSSKVYQILCTKLNHRDGVVGSGSALTKDHLKAIAECEQTDHTLRSYLDCFERFAVALRSGLLDESLVYEIEGGRVCRTFETFGPYIAAVQEKSPKAYIVLEGLANEWKERRKAERLKKKT